MKKITIVICICVILIISITALMINNKEDEIVNQYKDLTDIKIDNDISENINLKLVYNDIEYTMTDFNLNDQFDIFNDLINLKDVEVEDNSDTKILDEDSYYAIVTTDNNTNKVFRFELTENNTKLIFDNAYIEDPNVYPDSATFEIYIGMSVDEFFYKMKNHNKDTNLFDIYNIKGMYYFEDGTINDYYNCNFSYTFIYNDCFVYLIFNQGKLQVIGIGDEEYRFK